MVSTTAATPPWMALPGLKPALIIRSSRSILVHRRPEGLVIVEGVPVADGLFKERHVLGILWLLDGQHHAAGLSTRRLSAKMRVIAENGLVSCRNMVGLHPVKALIGKSGERSSALA